MQKKTTFNEVAPKNKSALTDKEREHLSESMRHNDKLMKRLALL